MVSMKVMMTDHCPQKDPKILAEKCCLAILNLHVN